jgi:hypothetical protein
MANRFDPSGEDGTEVSLRRGKAPGSAGPHNDRDRLEPVVVNSGTAAQAF